ncbi:MAG TPA: DUF542 domain-containing protein [Baekduia sp.]|nr:DUF542 domain-containing protein [Baekduia sp.]
MTVIDPAAPLAEVVLAAPASVPLLEALRLDYCCHGERTLDEACAARGFDAPTLAAVLVALDEAGCDGRPDHHDVSRASIEELCEHLVVAHHGPLRTSLARIDHLLATVVRVHRGEHPELEDLQRLVTGLHAELDRHMADEEQVLFPACRALERQGGGTLGDEAIAALEHDHDDVGRTLVAIRELAGGYRTERAFCGTHRMLLEALRRLTAELHQHIHEENNVLFPRVRALANAG